MCASALRVSWALVLLCFQLMAARAWAEERTRHERTLVLSELPPGKVPELRVSPRVSTVLLFDEELAREAVVLEKREHFSRLEVAERAVVVEPGPEARPGRSFLLEVPFREEGLSPSRVSFRLVVHATEVDGEVRVERGGRSTEAGIRSNTGVLAGHILSRVLGSKDVTIRVFLGSSGGDGLMVAPPQLWSTDTWKAVVFRVKVPKGGAPWTPDMALWRAAVATESARVLPVWMEVERLGPGESGLVVVLVECTPGEAEVPLRLLVREKGGDRTVRLEEGGGN